MMALTPALLSVGFLLLLTQGALTNTGLLPVRLTVENDINNIPVQTYSSHAVNGGVLLGVLRRLQETQQDFKFTVTENADFGPFLQSVNGVAGDDTDQTYWELLSESSGEYERLNAGVGCYMPKENEHIVLRFSRFSLNNDE